MFLIHLQEKHSCIRTKLTQNIKFFDEICEEENQSEILMLRFHKKHRFHCLPANVSSTKLKQQPFSEGEK